MRRSKENHELKAPMGGGGGSIASPKKKGGYEVWETRTVKVRNKKTGRMEKQTIKRKKFVPQWQVDKE